MFVKMSLHFSIDFVKNSWGLLLTNIKFNIKNTTALQNIKEISVLNIFVYE